MARGNGRSINVKIPTIKVINALQTKLEKVKKDYANQNTNEAKYEKAVEKWSKEVATLAMAHTSLAKEVSANVRYSGEIHVEFNLPKGTFEIPARPQKDFEVVSHWQHKETVEEIENAIRILKLTDEEVVSTSTYNSIAKYL